MLKPLQGHGNAIRKSAISVEQALRYAMSLPVATSIMGIERPEVLRQNLQIAQNFQRMTAAAMQQTGQRERVRRRRPFRTVQRFTQVR